jgi:hypothetical protein
LEARPRQLCLRHHDHLLGRLAGPEQIGLALLLGDLCLDAGVGELRLHRRLGLCLGKEAHLLRGHPLALEGLELFDGELPFAELVEERLDLAGILAGLRLADEDIDASATHALILPWNIAPMLISKLGHLGLAFYVPQVQTLQENTH